MQVTKCTACGGEVWDNRQNKKNSKQPDWRCKNKDCKDGQYTTAGWDPKSEPGGSYTPPQEYASDPAPNHPTQQPSKPVIDVQTHIKWGQSMNLAMEYCKMDSTQPTMEHIQQTAEDFFQRLNNVPGTLPF